MLSWALSAAVMLAAGVLTAPALADSVTELAGRLAALRGQVESLSTEVAQKESDLRDELRALARQKADLELEAQKEQTRLQKTRLVIDQKRRVIEAEKSADQTLVPVFERALAQAREHVRRSLPFRTNERLAELQKIEDQYKSGLLTPQRALSRLWAFIEDEFRLTRESGIYRQTISVDGQDQLADVVRVGSVMLYFQASDGVVGHAERSDAGWHYVSLSDPEAKRQVEQLFESLKKQIRVGFFELPNALPPVGGS
jgi:hypothetical protein